MGFSKNLAREDMWQIDDTETCKILTAKLEVEWNKRAEE
jgi:hypothetical protein